nr:NftQ1 [Streptomyces conglobatus]
MRIPKAAHTAKPWRIHEFTQDFRIEDVWSFRAPDAGPDDFPVMLKALKTAYDTRKAPAPVRFLFAVRWKLGALLGWDTPGAGLGGRVASLRDRLPHDVAETVHDAVPCSDPFSDVYQLDNEAARELGNKTVHTIMHLGWVPTGDGGYELRMAALVKPNGLFGRLYMAAILPFRYLIVYPALTRQWERAWLDHGRPNRRAGDAARG